jgi:phytoene desaturase
MGRVAVVGGGFAGLAAAAALAARGHRVTILEAQPETGGAARRVVAAGARVDVGPTILTDLAPLRHLSAQVGSSLEELGALERIDPAFLVAFPGRARVPFCSDPSRTRAALEALGPHAGRDWETLLDLAARAERLAQHFYARGDIAGPADLLRFLAGGGISPRDLLPFIRYGSLGRLLAARVRTPELRTFLGHFARFVGLDAARAPAVTLVIPYLMLRQGVWYPRGGMAALAERIQDAGMKRGATVRPGTRVRGLEIHGRRVRAVRVADGTELAVDACVSAVDVAEAAAWLPGLRLGRRAARQRPGLAARVAWWVVEGRPPLAAHHAFHFADDLAAEPVYVAVPTVTDPGLAPAGTSVIYALVHGAYGEPISPETADGWRARAVAAGQWPGGRVLASGLSNGTGACYGYAIGPGLFSSFRPSQRVAGVNNLVLAGQSVFPGPGVANVIRSGLRAAALADASIAGGGP